MWLFNIVSEFAHQVALLPLLVLMLLVHFKNKKFSRNHWLLVLALSISWFADSASSMIINKGANPWIISYIYPIVQLGLIYLLLIESRKIILLTMFGLLVAAGILGTLQSFNTPDGFISIVGAVLVLWWVNHRTDLKVLRTILIIYFGAAAIFEVMFPWFMNDISLFLVVWYGYQLCRLIGIAMTIRFIYYQPIT